MKRDLAVSERNLLSGEKVRLTGLKKDDLPVILGWRVDTRFLRLWNSNPLVSRDEGEVSQWLDRTEKSEDEMTFAIRLLGNDHLIGIAELAEIEWSNRVASLGIGIGDPENWGKGYGTEATRLLMAYGFNELNLYRLQLTVLAYNIRAVGMYEKLGFIREGVLREFGERDGRRYDLYQYGLLRTEWKCERLP